LKCCRQEQQRSVVVLQAGAVVVELRLAAGVAAVWLGSSTVLAAVTIVVEHKACLSVVLYIADRT